MIQYTNTVRYGNLKDRPAIIDGRGFKALWVTGDLIASGDQEDLPPTSEPWVEVSEAVAWRW